jgi:tetratricopeptide (TPR) repeat protein
MQPLTESRTASNSRGLKPITTAIGILVVLLIAVLALQFFLDSLHWDHRAEFTATNASDEEKILSAKLMSYEKSADELKTLSSLILGLSTLFGLALGVNSYINLKETKEQYEKEITRLKENLQGELLAIHHDFPLFRGMHHSITAIGVKLREFIPDSDYGREELTRISTSDRMMIHYFERVVATFEFFDLGPFKIEASRIYTGLGSYYAHKYSHEQTLYRKAKARVSNSTVTMLKSETSETRIDPPMPEDIERARLYLRRAKSVQPENYLPLNEIGFLEVIVADKPENALAELMMSVDLNPSQQRARYYLSIIQHQLGVNLIASDPIRAAQHFRKSMDYLDEAFEQDRWQVTKPRTRYLKSMYYNYACSSARMADLDPEQAEKSKLYAGAVDYLKKCTPFARDEDVLRESFRADCAAGGDFEALAKNQEFSAKFGPLTKHAEAKEPKESNQTEDQPAL